MRNTKQAIVLIFILLLSYVAHTQTQKVLIADETYLIEKASSFTLECSNDSISKMIIDRLQGKFKALRVAQKKDRHGAYWVYSFTFPRESYNDMVVFINKVNSK